MPDMMRIAVCDRARHLELRRMPVPELTRDKALVRIAVCGVCASDLAVWQGTVRKEYPYSPGHEFCGVVERVDGPAVQVGERVVVDPNLGCGECPYCQAGRPNLCDFLKTRPIKSNGGFSEYVAVDCRMLHRLPESFADELTPFIEPMSCALHAVQRADAEREMQAIVFGAGAMGFLVALALSQLGCDVVVVEPDEDRRQQAATLLDVEAMTPQELADSNWAADLAIECSGSSQAVGQAILTLRKAGRLVLSGLVASEEQAALSLADVTMKELDVRGAWLNPNTFEDAIRVCVERESTLRALRTEVFRLDDIEAAFERTRTGDVTKVIVRP